MLCPDNLLYRNPGLGIIQKYQSSGPSRITKTGRKELRWILVEAAWRAADTHPYWKAQYERLDRRIGSTKAAVAIWARLGSY